MCYGGGGGSPICEIWLCLRSGKVLKSVKVKKIKRGGSKHICGFSTFNRPVSHPILGVTGISGLSHAHQHWYLKSTFFVNH